VKKMDTGLHYPLNVELLPPGWYSGYIGEFSDEIQSGFACGQHSDDNIGVSHLRPMNVSREGKIDLSVLKYVAASYDGRRLKEGDVLFNNTNSPELIGKTAYVDESVSGLAFSNHMTAIRLCGAVYPKFAAYQLHFLWMARYYLHKCVKHVNQASISSTELGKTIPFLVPPLNEQHRIVAKIEELLSELDKGIESLKTAREQLRVYRQAVLKHAFEGTLTAHWREGNKNRLESSKSIIEHILKTRRQQWREKGKYKEPQTPDAANLSDLPPGWVWVTVDHLLTETLMNGHSVRDSTNGFPVLRLTALKSGRIDLSERKKGDWTEKDAEPYLVSQGDFYVSRGNGSKKLVGIGGLVVEKPEPIAFPDTFIRIRINSNMCDISQRPPAKPEA
jgi:type I restriction enzyme, S subunit